MEQNSKIYVAGHRGMVGSAIAVSYTHLDVYKRQGPRDVIIDGRNGFLIEMNNKQAFVNALSLITQNNTLRKTMGINAKKDSMRFCEDNIFQKWIDLICSL